ncbi:Hydroxycarboxylic acid receptor like [Actinidia chinensis var. chinensis]|uniref:Hydroxycarboxylic acid receptor like n=1 Tax=Actinidia chinensis var. chinensis TaxID=1590841 RepID=A0A2R6QH59_ACTCC|nr:Hydroxycarboxylic acid receptor like [Actinidia chinensis var. chinensis]
MKSMKSLIMDMQFDLLKYIMILMVKSSDGATTLARAVSVCSVFMKVAEDTDILKAVSFDNVNVTYRYELFQQTNGLLYRCAQVGNEAARYLLAKIVLVSSSQLLPRITKSEPKQTLWGCRHAMYEVRHIKIPRDDAMAAAFMPHFLPDQACSTRGLGQTGLLHWELVRKFLYQCTTLDFTEMHPHLNRYIDYFTEQRSQCNHILHCVPPCLSRQSFRRGVNGACKTRKRTIQGENSIF